MADRIRTEYQDDESIVDRSVSFFKDLGSRLREQAGRKWRSTNINLDIGLLRRRRRHWVLQLGQAAYEMMEKGDVDTAELRDYGDEIRALEQKIAAKQSLLNELEADDDLEADDQEMGAEA